MWKATQIRNLKFKRGSQGKGIGFEKLSLKLTLFDKVNPYFFECDFKVWIFKNNLRFNEMLS